MDGIVHAVGENQDHVHLAVSIPPKLAPANFISEVKGDASHFINHVTKPGLAFYWQDEYGALTFGEKDLPAVVRYLQNQKKHHAEGTVLAAIEIDRICTSKQKMFAVGQTCPKINSIFGLPSHP
jgi:putative transposase